MYSSKLKNCSAASSAIVYKCDLCEFETIHHPALNSHMTKMYGRKMEHQCEQCSDKYEARKTFMSWAEQRRKTYMIWYAYLTMDRYKDTEVKQSNATAQYMIS